jgi:RNA polymerase sigma-70 factor (ECF subfamily)
MGEPSGQDLLARIRAGEEDAARQFFREHHALVARIVRNHASRRHSEEDLCQMVFMKIFTRLDQYAGEVPVTHWISRIAVNTCLVELKKDALRKELREADLGEDAVMLLQRVADPATQEADGARDAQEVAQRLLERLSPTDRMIVALLYIEQYSVAETSQRTGLPQAVIKIRAFRARRKLNKLIQQLGDKIL